MAADLGVTLSHLSHVLAGRRRSDRLEAAIAAYLAKLPVQRGASAPAARA